MGRAREEEEERQQWRPVLAHDKETSIPNFNRSLRIRTAPAFALGMNGSWPKILVEYRSIFGRESILARTNDSAKGRRMRSRGPIWARRPQNVCRHSPAAAAIAVGRSRREAQRGAAAIDRGYGRERYGENGAPGSVHGSAKYFLTSLSPLKYEEPLKFYRSLIPNKEGSCVEYLARDGGWRRR